MTDSIVPLRTRVLDLKDRTDNYTELTILIDRYREKEMFKKLVDAYRDDKTIVLRWVNDD